MNVYLADIRSATLIFLGVAAVLTLPFMIYHYRKRGAVQWYYALLVFSFIFYLLCAYCLVLLPLPEDRSIFIPEAQYFHWMPFNTFEGWLPILNSDLSVLAKIRAMLLAPCTYQYLFNIMLLMPLGMYLRYAFKRNWWQTVLICFAVSMSFEMLQFTGILGYYEHAYRIADMDDLIANTLGGWLGYLLAGPVIKVLPLLADVDAKARQAGLRASTTQRAISFLLDMVFMIVLTVLVQTVGSVIAGRFFGIENWASQMPFFTVQVILFCVTFALVPAITHGQTPGQLLLRIYVARLDGSRAPWWQVFLRYALMFLLMTTPLFLMAGVSLAIVTAGPENPLVQILIENEYLIFGVFAALVIAYVLTLFLRAFSAWRRQAPFVLLNGLVTRTRILSVFALKKQEAEEAAPDPDFDEE